MRETANISFYYFTPQVSVSINCIFSVYEESNSVTSLLSCESFLFYRRQAHRRAILLECGWCCWRGITWDASKSCNRVTCFISREKVLHNSVEKFAILSPLLKQALHPCAGLPRPLCQCRPTAASAAVKTVANTHMCTQLSCYFNLKGNTLDYKGNPLDYT